MKSPNKRHPKKARDLDLYETPPEAVWALLRHEQLPRVCWDPCCGPGNIVSVLRHSSNYRTCYGSDIKDYGGLNCWVADFLNTDLGQPPELEAIVMNPPYGKAEAFVARALALSERVYALLRLNWVAARRENSPGIYDRLARIHVFARRLPMMHRAGWTGRRASNGHDHAWFVFERQPPAAIQLKRIDWKEGT